MSAIFDEILTPRSYFGRTHPALCRAMAKEAGVIKQLKVSLDITETYIGDLIVDPAERKRRSITAPAPANLGTSYNSSSLAALAVFMGQGVQCDWVLKVRDVAEQYVGKLNRWSLEFFFEGGAESACGEATPNLQIPDNSPAGVNRTIAIERPGSAPAWLKVSIDITHTYVGDLRIELVSPAGRGVVLHGQLGGGQDNLAVTYDSAALLSPLLSALGQPTQGNWALRVADLAAVNVGTLNKLRLEICRGVEVDARLANAPMNYLLQSIENHVGIVLLTRD